MLRKVLDRELQQLEDEILSLGSLVETAIRESVVLLAKRDLERSRRLIAQDGTINERRFAIESDALALIATQQPMASDLRTIAAILDVASELERIGDYAKGIAKITLMIGEKPLVKPLVDVPLMAEKAANMLRSALAAFAERDAEMARVIPEHDDEVDALYNQVYRELLTLIIANPSVIDQATLLLWVAHNLERAADRVSNICERIIFTVTGEVLELDVENEGLHGVR